MSSQAALCGQMLDMAIGHWKATFLAVAAQLGIADILQDKSMTAEELAQHTKTHAPSLHRLLRALSSMGLFHEDEENRFSLTPLGATLKSGVLRHVVTTISGWEYEPWDHFMHCIKTGENGYLHKHGINYYDHLKKVAGEPNNEEFHHFRLACMESTKMFNFNIPSYYDFSQFKHIVDLGGNDGSWLIRVLECAPKSKGTVFDEAPNIAEAKKNIANSSVKDRMDAVAGSFLDSVPAGADCYMMKSVFVDWVGEKAKKILTNIRQQMKPGSKFILIQSDVPERNEPHPGKFFDLYYLLFTQGRERSRSELAAELKPYGLKVNKVIRGDYPIYDVIEIVLE